MHLQSQFHLVHNKSLLDVLHAVLTVRQVRRIDGLHAGLLFIIVYKPWLKISHIYYYYFSVYLFIH